MDSFLQMLGIANRAGAVISGTLSCEKALKHGRAKLLIFAEDAADEVLDSLGCLAERSSVQTIRHRSKNALGAAIGKSHRAAIVITDDGLAKRLYELSL
ncbi:MAG TPA: L7Ae/L30e/S12e/Gadd45 family ribosomal protein [Bacillota bacterium]|nr:L7Ae/L30e/S12e/Gadd45 family ribosomal protein [Bacillota bacterium]